MRRFAQIGHRWRAHEAPKSVVECAHTQPNGGRDVGHGFDLGRPVLDELQCLADRFGGEHGRGLGQLLTVVVRLADKQTRHHQMPQARGHRRDRGEARQGLSAHLCSNDSVRDHGVAADSESCEPNCSGRVGAPQHLSQLGLDRCLLENQRLDRTIVGHVIDDDGAARRNDCRLIRRRAVRCCRCGW